MRDEQPANPPRANRRRYPRFGIRGEPRVECRLDGRGPDLTRGAVDLSSGGLCLLLSQTPEPGRAVEVRVQAPWLSDPLCRLARVVWVRPGSDGGCYAGLSLRPLLPDAVLDRLKADAGADEELPPTVRGQSHTRLHPLAQALPQAGERNAPRWYWIFQLTPQQVVLIADQPWPPESPAVTVFLWTAPPAPVRFPLAARVQEQATLPNGKRLVGCTFTPPLGREVLERLA